MRTTRFVILPALLLMTACSGGLQIPDFRRNSPAPEPVRLTPPTPSAPVVLTAKERLATAMENNGCELNMQNGGMVMSEATVGRSQMERLIAELSAEGRVEVAGDGAIRVLSSRCI